MWYGGPGMNPREMLAEYERLFRAGIISPEEYERQVARLKAEMRRQAVEEEGLGAVLNLDPLAMFRILRSQVFWVVLLLAMMPFLLAALGVAPDEGMILYFAFLWFFLFLRLFRLELRESRPWDVSLVIALVVFPGLTVLLPLLRIVLGPLYALVDLPFIPLRWLGFVWGVGVTEELTKALPVLVVLALARRQGRRLGLQTSLLLGIASGLAFAGFENILYSQQFGARIWGIDFTRPDVVLSRLLMTPFLHSLWAGLLGFALGLVNVTGRLGVPRMLRIAGPALVLAALLHGTYDTVAAVPLLAVMVGGMSYLVLVLAVLAAKGWEGGDAAFLNERVI